jgi:hypothetical protein
MAKGGTRWTLGDYMLKFEAQDAGDKAREMEMIATAWAVTHNRRLEKGGK